MLLRELLTITWIVSPPPHKNFRLEIRILNSTAAAEDVWRWIVFLVPQRGATELSFCCACEVHWLQRNFHLWIGIHFYEQKNGKIGSKRSRNGIIQLVGMRIQSAFLLNYNKNFNLLTHFYIQSLNIICSPNTLKPKDYKIWSIKTDPRFLPLIIPRNNTLDDRMACCTHRKEYLAQLPNSVLI